MIFKDILLIFLGMILGALFQDCINRGVIQIKRWVISLYYRIESIFNPKSSTNTNEFIFASRQTSVLVLDGDGHRTFSNSDINIRVETAEKNPWIEDMQPIYEQTEQELQRKRDQGKTGLWNGNVFSVWKYIPSRTREREEFKMDLSVRPVEYDWIYATIHNLDAKGPVTGLTLRSYIDQFSFDDSGEYRLPNGLGICMMVETADNQVIFGCRSMNSGFRAGEYDVSIVEGLNPNLDMTNNRIDIFSVARRAFSEEICEADSKSLDPYILGLIFDKKYNQWNIIGYIKTSLTKEKITLRRNTGSLGKWELKSLSFVSNSLKDITLFLSSHEMWDTGLVTAYYYLVACGHRKEDINKWLEKYARPMR